MPENLGPMILLVGVGGVIAMLGIIVYAIFGMGGKDKEKERAKEKGTERPPPPDPAAKSLGNLFNRPEPAPPSAEARPGAPTGGHEVLRVLRDHLTGRLSVELAGRRYARFSDIQDADLADAMLTTVRDLHKFTQAPVAASGPAPMAPVPSKPAVTPLASPPPAPPPAPVRTPAPLEADVIPVPSMNPFKQMKVLQERAKAPPPVLKSIPEIIDEFLQQKVAGTPYLTRGIKVRGDLKGAVVFEVDGKAYDAVDAVPDPDVRNLIKKAIAEWDAKK